jgi:hypothetical protein
MIGNDIPDLLAYCLYCKFDLFFLIMSFLRIHSTQLLLRIYSASIRFRITSPSLQ